MRNKRSLLINANKYQKKVISLAFIPLILVCVLISFWTLLSHNILLDAILNRSQVEGVHHINQWVVYTFIIILALLIFFISLTLRIAGNLVGAFERIINELDLVIEKNQKKKITARTNDDLANELLKRINILIDNYKP